MIIGFGGFAGSGKSTAAQYFVEHHGFTRISFATGVKDVASALFGWDRQKLEGATPEDRAWREVPDSFWSEALNRPWSPRYALQYVGTDLCRVNLSDTIWIDRVRAAILALGPNPKVVIDDVRFVNEREAIREWGGTLVTLHRPSAYGNIQQRLWQQVIVAGESFTRPGPFSATPEESGLHISEWHWLCDSTVRTAPVLVNDGTTDDFHRALASWYTTTMERTLYSEELYA